MYARVADISILLTTVLGQALGQGVFYSGHTLSLFLTLPVPGKCNLKIPLMHSLIHSSSLTSYNTPSMVLYSLVSFFRTTKFFLKEGVEKTYKPSK